MSTTSTTSSTPTTSSQLVKERVVAVVLAKPKIRLISLVEEIRRELEEAKELRGEVEELVDEMVDEGMLELEYQPWGLGTGF